MRIIDACTGWQGPLNESERQSLRTLLRQTDETTWYNARHTLISPVPYLTLEIAVEVVSGRRLSGVPDEFTLHRALRYAVTARRKYLSEPHPLSVREFELL